MVERSAHNRLVVGSIPTGPRIGHFSEEEFSVRDMLTMLLGSDGKRKLRLRNKTNDELFALYDSQLILKHSSDDALEEARRVLRHFKTYLGEMPPTPELAAGFLAQFKNRKPTTLYRYDSIVKGFMWWYGEKLETKIKVPDTLPDYIEAADIENLKQAMRNKKTHKKVIDRNILLIDVGCKTGLRRAEIANLKVGDINLDRRYLTVRLGKGMKDRIIDLTPSLTQSFETYLKGKAPTDSVFGLKASTISGVIRWAAMKAGVDLHCHSLRHFFGEKLVDTGTDLETVRRLMGHARLSTTQRYIGRTDKQRKEAVERLEEPLDEEKTDNLKSIGKTNDRGMQGLIEELKSFTANLGGMRFNGASIIQKLWGRFGLGMSRNNLVEALTKDYPSENPGKEYFEIADLILEELDLLQIIRSEQRRDTNIRSQWDATYWVLTDNGRKVVRYLKVGENGAM